MGIRNLAYCILDVHPKFTLIPNRKSNTDGVLPSIYAWHRLAVSTAPAKSLDAEIPTAKEAFDPSTLSAAAYALLRKRLLPLNPTHILIERQRFRSMGSKHILEWTIRVNMFESIIYAVLCTLREEGMWKGEVKAITPGKVGPFWVGEAGDRDDGEGSRKERKSKSAKVRNKGLKIDLVRKWLESGEMVTLGNVEVEAMAKAYREKWDRVPGGKKGGRITGETEEKMGKLVDLADCLLQGMARLKWEENKMVAVNSGVDALLEL